MPLEAHQRRASARTKLSLLCSGISFPLNLFAGLSADFYANQFVYGRTSRGALRAHNLPQVLKLGTGVVSALLRRENSPWSIEVSGDRLLLLQAGTEVVPVELPERPAYFGHTLSNGALSDDFIAVAGEATPGFFIYPDCHYFPAGVPCGFCSLRHTRRTAGRDMAGDFPLDVVAEATRLIQATKWKDIPLISITTGTFPDSDEGARYTSRLVRAVYDALKPKVPIHVLTMPPASLQLLSLYREAGATSIAFNVEVFDRDTFAEVCPGKHKYYGYDKMLRALQAAVPVFGEWNVFGGFVWGLEAPKTLLAGYRWCLDQGIAISSNVFHADQGSRFADHPHPPEEIVLSLCEAQSALYDEYPEARTIFPVSMRSTLDWEIRRGDFA